MGQKSTIFEIIKQYYYSYDEILRAKLNYIIFSFKTKKTFENHEKMNILLKEEIDKYLENVYCEMAVLDFILKHERKLFISDIYNTLNTFDENYIERLRFIENILENLQTAIDMKLDYKFYIPQKRHKNLTEEDYQKFLIFIKGFNIERIKEFLIDENVYTEEKIEQTLNEAKILNIETRNNLDLFGVYENKLVLPNVIDQSSSLVNIHELVHNALLSKESEIDDDEIVLGEDLPIFYELLFKKFNKFVSKDVHTTDLALELLKDYKYENFDEQIIKLKRLKEIQR